MDAVIEVALMVVITVPLAGLFRHKQRREIEQAVTESMIEWLRSLRVDLPNITDQ